MATTTTSERPADPSDIEARVATYYGGMGLVERIEEDLARGGFDRDHPSPEGPRLYGSFHIGGAEAVERLLDAMPPLDGRPVLDIGCGVGGTVRALARRGAKARGVDITPEFIEVARGLSRMVGGDPGVFKVGSARALPYRDQSFDHAMMLHVGMNIADKGAAMREAARVTRPGGIFAIYDILRVGPGEIAAPLPWAGDSETSFVGTAESYLAAAGAAFTETARADRTAEGIAFLAPLIGPDPARPISDAMRGKLATLLAAFEAGVLAPVELMLRRRD